MYVQLKQPKQIERFGKPTQFKAGDWADIGEQLAKQWLADGTVHIPEQKVTQLLSSGCGLNITGPVPPTILPRLQESDRLGITESDGPGLPYPQTCIWNPAVVLRPELLPVGFAQLNTWQVACPLWDYSELACHMGNEAEKERTEAVIRDLRVPMYDTRLMWVRRCGDTQRLIDQWRAERTDGEDDKLAFLRALYHVKPMILALPVTWAGKRGPERN